MISIPINIFQDLQFILVHIEIAIFLRFLFLNIFSRGVNGKVTTSVKIYECCHGYERQEDEPGCVKGELIK